MNVCGTSPPPRPGNTPSLEDYFEGENGGVERVEGTGIPKKHLYERLGVSEVLEDFGGVAFGFDGGPDGLDFAGFADEERTADDAHEFASHELLLLPGAVGGDGFVIGVAEQRKIEFEFGLEQGLGFDRVGARAEDGHFEMIELLFCVTKLGRFDDSTGGVGFGKEKEEDAFAFEILEGDGFVFVGLQAERGGFVAGLEHRDPLLCWTVSVRMRCGQVYAEILRQSSSDCLRMTSSPCYNELGRQKISIRL
jgi:hypothetical protein